MKYRKKPVVIEAWQWNGTQELYRELLRHGFQMSHMSGDNSGKITSISISTLEGVLHVSNNDWIIKGIKGEFYPCKPDIFEATYEKVEGFHMRYTASTFQKIIYVLFVNYKWVEKFHMDKKFVSLILIGREEYE